MRGWITKEPARAKELSKTAPAEAVGRMEVLLKTVKGMPKALTAEAKELIKGL